MPRKNRKSHQLRSVRMKTGYPKSAEGACLIEFGNTHVLCTASVEESVPGHRKNTGLGWVTAEYGMLPRSTDTRMRREADKGKISGRTAEIQRLIGRALRSVVDFKSLGERSVYIDCDVLQADGGTRTAAITGGYIALAIACRHLLKKNLIEKWPLKDTVAAVSVGIVEGKECLDLEYIEDSQAEVDMNVVMTGRGKFVEVQGTAESNPFEKTEMEKMLQLARKGIEDLTQKQKQILKKMGL